jgi:hypothetical protein
MALTSMEGIINTTKFEELLLANWTSFINYKDLFQLVYEQQPPMKVNKLTLSRFEPIASGFIIWIEISDLSGSTGTIELYLSNFGIPSQAKIVMNSDNAQYF